MLARRDFASSSSELQIDEDAEVVEDEMDNSGGNYRMKRVLSDGDDVSRRACRPEFESHPAIVGKSSSQEDHTKRYLYELSRYVQVLLCSPFC